MLSFRLIDGMTFEQIGFEMGMTTKTVRTRIHKGEETLFKHIPG
jgi:DNA-directed RNA polymerase specialized sigma24 family protein